MNLLRRLLDVLRGGLIGVVEIIPGVSGGTMALIVGVYDDLIGSASSFVRGAVRAIVDPLRGKGLTHASAHFRQVKWAVVLPIAVGMITAVVIGASVVAPLIENYPVQTRALFTGLIVASIVVPARMVGGFWRLRDYGLAALAAVAAFLLTGLPAANAVDPSPVMVAIAAAVAVCALVLPGLSGSFILLTVGMYAPTLAAVNERNFAYLGIFILGAIIGLGSFVSVLQWLLEHRRRVTLAIMTGLMIGSLRALWPWQGDGGQLRAPEGDLLPAMLLFAGGILVVTSLLIVESRVRRRQLTQDARG